MRILVPLRHPGIEIVARRASLAGENHGKLATRGIDIDALGATGESGAHGAGELALAEATFGTLLVAQIARLGLAGGLRDGNTPFTEKVSHFVTSARPRAQLALVARSAWSGTVRHVRHRAARSAWTTCLTHCRISKKNLASSRKSYPHNMLS
jgi:hypothetical protein